MNYLIRLSLIKFNIRVVKNKLRDACIHLIVLNYVMLCKGTFLRGIINDIILSICLEVIIFITYDIILFFLYNFLIGFSQ